MSWWAWLLVVYAVVGPVVWALCRMAAGDDVPGAQQRLLALLAEQADQRERADDRAIAENLDV